MDIHTHLPPYTNILQFYNNTPTGHTTTTPDAGTPTTASLAITPSNRPHSRDFPLRVLEDPQMCHAIITAAREYIANYSPSTATAPYGIGIGNLANDHVFTQRHLNRDTGDEVINADFFSTVMRYVCSFVRIVDGLDGNDVKIKGVLCENMLRDGVLGSKVSGLRNDGDGANVNPVRTLVREDVKRAIVEVTSVAAFDQHVGAIREMARGEGTEMIFQDIAHGAQAIILKLGYHMINTSCVWGLIVGGNEYMVVYLDKRDDSENNNGGDICYYMVVSDRHQTLPASALPESGTPSLIQVLVALLLGSPCLIGGSYSPPKVPIRTRPSRVSTSTGERPATMITSANSEVGKAGDKPINKSRQESILDSTQFCALVFPHSGLPDREMALIHINATKAKAIMSGQVEDIPETAPDTYGPHPLISRAERAGKLFAFEELNSGVAGTAYNSLCFVNGSEIPCTVKVVQYDFIAVSNEVDIYEQLRGNHFVPDFYGAFAGMWVTGPLGVIVIEYLDKIFESYEEMDERQKQGALECLKEMHRAGIHNGDISPRHFGVRNDEVVIFDLSHAGPCWPCDRTATDVCYNIRRLEENLFG